jgi:hypothetical protein
MVQTADLRKCNNGACGGWLRALSLIEEHGAGLRLTPVGRERYLALPNRSAIYEADTPDEFISKMAEFMTKARLAATAQEGLWDARDLSPQCFAGRCLGRDLRELRLGKTRTGR